MESDVARFAGLAAAFLAAASALAQESPPDVCKTPLSVQSSMPELQMFRLRCTIQAALNDRNEQASRAIVAEVEEAAFKAKLDSAEAELAETRKKLGDAEAKLKAMKGAIAALEDKLKATNTSFLNWFKEQLRLLGVSGV